MDRTQKKCLMASVAMHALLVAVVAVAPGFLKKEKEIEFKPLDYIPERVVEEAMKRGGGSVAPKVVEPKAAPTPAPRPVTPPPTPRPTPPKPVVKPEKKPDPPVVRETPKPPTKPKPAPKAEPKPKPRPTTAPKKPVVKSKLEPPPVKTKPKPVVKIQTSFDNIQKRSTTDNSAQLKRERERERQQKERERRQRIEQAAKLAMLKKSQDDWKNAKIQQSRFEAASRIKAGLQPSLSISDAGGGGAASASYQQLVYAIYDAAWKNRRVPGSPGDYVRVRITVARSGKVTEEKIMDESGNSALRRSVQDGLRRVDEIKPFSLGSTDNTRTFIIRFTLPPK